MRARLVLALALSLALAEAAAPSLLSLSAWCCRPPAPPPPSLRRDRRRKDGASCRPGNSSSCGSESSRRWCARCGLVAVWRALASPGPGGRAGCDRGRGGWAQAGAASRLAARRQRSLQRRGRSARRRRSHLQLTRQPPAFRRPVRSRSIHTSHDLPRPDSVQTVSRQRPDSVQTASRQRPDSKIGASRQLYGQ